MDVLLFPNPKVLEKMSHIFLANNPSAVAFDNSWHDTE